MNTIQVTKVHVTEEQYKFVAVKLAEKEIIKDLMKFTMPFSDELINELNYILGYDWVTFDEKKFRYNKATVSLIPDYEHHRFGEGYHWDCDVNASYMKFEGFKGDVLTSQEFKKIFKAKTSFTANKKSYSYAKVVNNGSSNSMNFSNFSSYINDKDQCVYVPIYRLNGVNSKEVSYLFALKLWMENNLVPKAFSEKVKAEYIKIKNLVSLGYLIMDNEEKITINIEELSSILSKLKAGSLILEAKGLSLNYAEKLQEILSRSSLETDSSSKEEIISLLKNDLLYRDTYRADFEPYPEKILVDPNAGHWELWEEESSGGNGYLLNGKFGLVARNPLADIKKNGVVGIDFGTKSTVVTYLDNNTILPMRIGTGDLLKKISKTHYENPTVMEFINLNQFLSDYQKRSGRPATRWEDIVVSHTAAEDILNANSTEFNAFINDLKQWAGDEKRIITLRDKQGENLILQPFHQLEAQDFNPIEIYAYYIGLYINNMWNGIFLDYMLSFPVTYDIKTRTRIANCFEKGLKKSLPVTVLQNEEAISKFRIDTDISEPAAYAVCALQEYSFDPSEDEKVFYGIFDFGGGTTDFDFGLWRGATSKERRFDYVIEHFGAGGDKYLGGENLLELLAFEVFKTNQDLMRQNKITFTLPPESKRFPGSEAIISVNQEARLNTKQLIEKLRPIWERHDGYEEIYEMSAIKVKLFNSAGEFKDYELVINQGEIETIIRNRVEKGIKNFFAAMSQAFTNPATEGVQNDQINIFLAGNSSKASIVQELFNEYIEMETEKLNGQYHTHFTANDKFRIFPPLGSEEANAILESRGVKLDAEDMDRPNGKTGVAFGLIKCRKGSKIKVVDSGIVAKGDEEEIAFQYFIGYEKKEKFILLDELKSSKSVYGKPDYNVWYNYIDAGLEDFELYYTKLPESVNGDLSISSALMKRERIDVVDDDAFVFIRAVDPRTVEYVVATEEGLEQGHYLTEVKRLILEEK
jgi:hypothetical protein